MGPSLPLELGWLLAIPGAPRCRAGSVAARAQTAGCAVANSEKRS